jgi:hypothetical protein
MLDASGDDVAAGDVGRNLVFVSYSHAAAVWAQRFRLLLKPLVRSKRLRLWDDTQIRATEKWHPTIEQAIARSQIALLLVSADFLDSDFIMERELPALLDDDVTLAPVLIAGCFWREVRTLAEVQFLHDPHPDNALALYADRPGDRDRRILHACERLLEVVPEPAAAGPPCGVASAPAAPRFGSPRPVAVVPEGGRWGLLSRVPPLPPGYVVREEMDGLVAAVAGTASSGAVGVTAEAAGVGLHGLGGIGSRCSRRPSPQTTASAAASRTACSGSPSASVPRCWRCSSTCWSAWAYAPKPGRPRKRRQHCARHCPASAPSW